VQGKLRIHLAEPTVIVAIAQAITLTPPTDCSVLDIRTTMSADKV
jgi:hypothetical protein